MLFILNTLNYVLSTVVKKENFQLPVEKIFDQNDSTLEKIRSEFGFYLNS